jgi:O-antigen/teichoic acid export membrane protein
MGQSTRSAGRTIARNTIFGILGTLVIKVATVSFQVFVINTLGQNNYGQYGTVAAWTSLFAVVGDMGISRYLAREIARDPSKKDELFWDTVLLRFVFAILCTLITVGGAILLTDYSLELREAIGIFCLTYFVQVLMAPLQSILTGHERMDVVNILNVVMQLLFMAFSVIFLLMGLGFVWLFIGGIINMPLIVAFQFWWVRRLKIQPPPFKLNRDLWLKIVTASLPFAAIQVSLSFSFRADTVLQSHFKIPFDDIGWYFAAYQLVFTMLGFVQNFTEAVMPTLSREHATNPGSIKPWYFNTSRVMFALGLPVGVGGILLADKMIAFLFRPQILPAAVPLAILVWDIPFVMYHAFCGNVAQSMQKEKRAAYIYGSLGIFNVLMNLFLIPRFGVIGSAFVTVMTDMFGAMQYYVFLRHELGAGLQFSRFVRIIIGCALMGLVLLLLRDRLNVILVILIGGAVYMTFAFTSGVFSPQERQRLVGMVTNRLAKLRPA